MLRTVGYSKMSWCVACNDVEIVLLNGSNNIYGVNECRVILKKLSAQMCIVLNMFCKYKRTT